MDATARLGAIFSLSRGDSIPAAEFAYLRGMYPRLTSTKLKESILMGVADDRIAHEDSDKLISDRVSR